jgi:ABC-type branched-subunit amino acid transport system substrate-binding protein
MVRVEWPLYIVRRVAFGTVAAVVLAVGGWFLVTWLQENAARCDAGVVEQGANDECVGVTDGSFAFAPHLKGVEDRIEKENKAVEKEGSQYVSVAYLTSFTLTKADSNTEESVRHELEGAYLAQQRVNNGDLVTSPKIRLLIANSGSNSAHWEYTVDELIKRKSAPDHLVAVTGLGPSTDANRAAVDKLSKNGIAMVASIMTATSFQNIPNFVRVAPTNTDEAQAAAGYLKRQKFGTAVVVQDAASSDLYADTLGKEFTKAFPDAKGHSLVAETMTYDSSVPNSWQTELQLMSSQLCEQKPRVIYFAGRGTHLPTLLNALSNRTCQALKFTVIAGDDTSNLTPKELTAAARTQISVLYTGLAHPDMYQKDSEAVSPDSAAYFAEGGRLDRWFPSDSRDDGQAMMAHDAVLTVAKGIQLAATGEGEVTGKAVARMFHQLRGGRQVAGASGFISFENNGNPSDKAVPVLRLTPSGAAEIVEVSAASGRPQVRS